MNIGDFYGLACFNSLSYFTRYGQISGLNRVEKPLGSKSSRAEIKGINVMRSALPDVERFS
jgi:hypothetical protein